MATAFLPSTVRRRHPQVRRSAGDGHRPVEALHRHDGDLARHARDRARRDQGAEDGQQLRVPRPAPLLRRRDLPPHHQGLHVPGRRPDRHRYAAGPATASPTSCPKAGQYEVGSVAMANAGPNTNGSQFFIVSGRSGVGLPPQYSLFGKVVKGLDVLETMQNVTTDRGDRPERTSSSTPSRSPSPTDSSRTGGRGDDQTPRSASRSNGDRQRRGAACGAATWRRAITAIVLSPAMHATGDRHRRVARRTQAEAAEQRGRGRREERRACRRSLGCGAARGRPRRR